MPCNRNLPDHCCYLANVTCQYLHDAGTTVNPRWTCTLRQSLGSWEAVHADKRYIENVKPTWDKYLVADCGDYSCLNCINGNA